MGQIISFLLSFLFQAEKQAPPTQAEENHEPEQTACDEAPLLNQVSETIDGEANDTGSEIQTPSQEPLLYSDASSKSASESVSDSNLSFQAPVEPEFLEPKSYNDVAKVLDETIELLKGGRREAEKVLKVDTDLVENIIEASGETSTTAATKDTKDYLFDRKSDEIEDDTENRVEEQNTTEEVNTAKELETAEKIFQEIVKEVEILMKNDGESPKNDCERLEKTEKLLANAEKLVEKNQGDPEEAITQDEFGEVTNEIPDEQNTLELLQATLDDEHAVAGEPESQEMDDLPNLPVDVELIELDSVEKRELKEAFGEENKNFIQELSYNIAKHTINNGKQVLKNEQTHVPRGSFSSMDVNMDSKEGREILETDVINDQTVEDEFNDENADPDNVVVGKVQQSVEVVIEKVVGAN